MLHAEFCGVSFPFFFTRFLIVLVTKGAAVRRFSIFCTGYRYTQGVCVWGGGQSMQNGGGGLNSPWNKIGVLTGPTLNFSRGGQYFRQGGYVSLLKGRGVVQMVIIYTPVPCHPGYQNCCNKLLINALHCL